MKMATTTCDFEKFCPTIKEQIAHIQAAGFKHIDLNLYEPRRYPELFYNDNWKEEARAIKEYCDSKGAVFLSHVMMKEKLGSGNIDKTFKYIEKEIERIAKLSR